MRTGRKGMAGYMWLIWQNYKIVRKVVQRNYKMIILHLLPFHLLILGSPHFEILAIQKEITLQHRASLPVIFFSIEYGNVA